MARDKYKNTEDVLKGAMTAIVLATGILCAARISGNTDTPEDVRETQKQMRSALKDPAITDRLIEQLKDPSVIQGFMDDPEIMQNLRKLADAVDGHAKVSPGQKEALDDSSPGNWADKALRDKGVLPDFF